MPSPNPAELSRLLSSVFSVKVYRAPSVEACVGHLMGSTVGSSVRAAVRLPGWLAEFVKCVGQLTGPLSVPVGLWGL